MINKNKHNILPITFVFVLGIDDGVTNGDTFFSRVVLEVCTSSNVFVFSNKFDGMIATILGIDGVAFNVVKAIAEVAFALRVGTCDSKVCEDVVIDTSGANALGNDI